MSNIQYNTLKTSVYSAEKSVYKQNVQELVYFNHKLVQMDIHMYMHTYATLSLPQSHN